MTPEEIQQLADAIAERLKATSGDLDWSAIDIPSAENPRPQCGKLGDRAVAQLKVIAALRYDGATAPVIRTAVMLYLAQKWGGHLADLKTIAVQHGLTPEQAFEQIVKGELTL